MIPYQLDVKEIIREGYRLFPMILILFLALINKDSLLNYGLVLIMAMYGIFCEAMGELNVEERLTGVRT